MLLQLYVTLGAMWTGMSFEGQATIEILLIRLSFKRSHANPCPLLSVRLTNAADFFLEWNPEGHFRGGKKKTGGERGSETEEMGVGGVRLSKSDDIHREGWQKMYVNLLKSSMEKQEFAE